VKIHPSHHEKVGVLASAPIGWRGDREDLIAFCGMEVSREPQDTLDALDRTKVRVAKPTEPIETISDTATGQSRLGGGVINSQQSQQLYTLSVQSYLSLSNHRPVSKEPSAMVAESPWASETSQRLDPAVAPGTSPSALPRTFALGRVGRLTRFVSAVCPAVVLRQGSRCWAARFVGPGDPKLLTWVLSWACSPTQNT